MDNDNTLGAVTEELRRAAEVLGPGGRLPSVRDLMARHGAGPGTVQRAVAGLVGEGLVEARPGRGTFVAARPAERGRGDLGWQAVALGERAAPADGLEELVAVPRVGAIPLSSGYLSDDLLPVPQLAAAAARAARRPGAWGRVPVEGSEGLRAWFAREAGSGLRANDVVVTPGGQAALYTAFRALAAPGSPVAVESPTYLGALAAARSAGLRCVPVPTDEKGVRPEMLEEALALSGAKLFYCQPTYANPHAAVLSVERREAVLEAVRGAGAFLIEDDSMRDLALEGGAPPPLVGDDPDGHVVYVRSLTKSVAPGMRIAALCARGAAGARLRAARVVGDFFVSGVLQETALEFLASPAWRRHRRAVLAALKERRDALASALREHLPGGRLGLFPSGGLHLWLGLPDGIDELEVAAEAGRNGVVVSPGRHWFPAEPPGPFLRLSYGGADPGALSEGVGVLRRVLGNARPSRAVQGL